MDHELKLQNTYFFYKNIYFSKCEGPGRSETDCYALLGNTFLSRILHTLKTIFFFFFFFFFLLFRAAPAAYGHSQARGQIRAIVAGLHHSQSNARSATYTTTQGNTRSLTHWARTGMEPTSSWILVRFITHWATTGTPQAIFLRVFYYLK